MLEQHERRWPPLKPNAGPFCWVASPGLKRGLRPGPCMFFPGRLFIFPRLKPVRSKSALTFHASIQTFPAFSLLFFPSLCFRTTEVERRRAPAEEGVKCLSTHLNQPAAPLRALTFMTAGEEEEKYGEDTRMEKGSGLPSFPESQLWEQRLIISPKTTFVVELHCLLKGSAVLYVTHHYNLIH